MKKITFILLFALLFGFSTDTNAQILNQTADWTNSSWSNPTGVFTPAGLLNNPQTSGLFTFDDDAAGNGSADTIESESPVIDLTAAAGGGETTVSISGNFVYRALGGDVLSIDYWDADTMTWVQVAAFAGNSTNTDYQTCAALAGYVSPDIDISGFTPTQLSGFKYRFSYDDQGGWQWGWCLDPPTITSAAPPTCDVVTAVLIDSLLDTSLDFSWTAPALGTPVSYDWEVVPSGNAQGMGTVVSGSEIHPDTSASTGAVLMPATDYDLYIVTNCGGAGSATFGPAAFTTTTPPPANDNACNATTITLGNAPVTYTNEGATTETDEPGGSCWFNAGSVSNSVWFTFTIGVDTNVTVSTDFATGGTLGDTQIAVYSGDCMTLLGLTEVGCDDDTGTGLLSIATLNGLVAGTYLIQIEGFGTDVGTFDLEVTGVPLSVEGFENENAFTYFPNPTKNSLTLKAANEIQNVSIYNMLGQEVLRTAPNAIEKDIDMSSLQTGTYFVQVTINDVTETVRIIKQ